MGSRGLAMVIRGVKQHSSGIRRFRRVLGWFNSDSKAFEDVWGLIKASMGFLGFKGFSGFQRERQRFPEVSNEVPES